MDNEQERSRDLAALAVPLVGSLEESKEHLGGFYVIEAADLDEALDWAERTVDATGRPIEVWPFFATASQ